MTEITLSNISGSSPIDVYIADYAGNNKEFLATITGDISLPITSTTFNTMTNIMVILSGTNGCELQQIVDCGVL
jgi:hypothetical protein